MSHQELALGWAVEAARHSECAKSQRGAAVWAPGEREPRATGWNHQPGALECDGSAACRAACGKRCIHAEADALLRLACPARARTRPLPELHLIHVKVEDGQPVASGPPSCWQCSRTVLAHGAVVAMWLLHEDGLRRYSPAEFHRLTLENCGLALETEVEGVESTRGRISLRKCGKQWLVYIGDSEDCTGDEVFARAYYAGATRATLMADDEQNRWRGLDKLVTELYRLRANPCPTMKFGTDSDDLLCAVVDEVVECRRETPLERLGEAGDVLATAVHLVIAEGGDPELEMAKVAAKLQRRLDYVVGGGTWASAKELEERRCHACESALFCPAHPTTSR